jgi:Zn ribbon nucleic-acid-binding protein
MPRLNICPECGAKDRDNKTVWRNSCGEIECDNCGYSEADENNDND